MHLDIKRKVALGVSALALTAFAGGAYAATQDSGMNARQAFLDDVAKRLHVTPQQLTAAMKGAALDQLSAAVAAGKLTQAQANAIRQHIQQNGGAPFGPFLFGPRGGLPGGPSVPGAPIGPGAPGGPGAPAAPGVPGAPSAPGFFHGPRFFGGGPGPDAGPVGAAAKYLGLSDTELLKQLASGKSPAQIARAHGKSASGLKDAMVAAIKARLDKAVAAKLMTSAQERQIVSRLSAGFDALVNHAGLGPTFGGPGSGPAMPGAHRAFRYRYGPAMLGAPRAFRYGSGPATPAQGPAGPIA